MKYKLNLSLREVWCFVADGVKVEGDELMVLDRRAIRPIQVFRRQTSPGPIFIGCGELTIGKIRPI